MGHPLASQTPPTPHQTQVLSSPRLPLTDLYNEKKRVATKQYKYSPSRVQQSSIAIAKREGESSKSAVSEDSHGTKEKVATKHNKYSASRVVFTSPLQPVKHWYN